MVGLVAVDTHGRMVFRPRYTTGHAMLWRSPVSMYSMYFNILAVPSILGDHGGAGMNDMLVRDILRRPEVTRADARRCQQLSNPGADQPGHARAESAWVEAGYATDTYTQYKLRGIMPFCRFGFVFGMREDRMLGGWRHGWSNVVAA